MNEMKTISVLMSVHNTPKEFLCPAIESILNQTYRNFEFVIIDDCSDKETKELLMSYDDDRIRIHHNVDNLGLTKSLNIGLSLCRGDYIARMDSDDVALPDRLECQLKYIEKSDFCVIGSEYEFYPKKKYKRFITEDINKQRIRMMFSNVGIIHSTAFIDRKKMIDKNISYNELYKKSQDYGLWCDFLKQGLALGNCPKVLLRWRESANQISKTNADEQKNCREMIRRDYIHDVVEISDESCEYLIDMFDGNIDIENDAFNDVSKLLLELINNNRSIRNFESEICRIWLIQVIRKILIEKSIGILFNRLTFKAIKLSNMFYFVKCYFEEIHVYK